MAVFSAVGPRENHVRTYPASTREAANGSWLAMNHFEHALSLWALSAAESTQIFGVPPELLEEWRKSAPPPDKAPAVADFLAATYLLEHHLKQESIEDVVRRPVELLGNKALIQLAREGKHADLRSTVGMMFNLRRAQP